MSNKKCELFDSHQFNYNINLSDTSKSVFSCICGEVEVEFEDAGTGA